MRIILAFGVLLLSSPVNAACDTSQYNLIYMQKAYNEFNSDPNKQTAFVFFNSIPSTFCEFNEIYGWRRDNPGPLYELQLHGTLENLSDYIDADELALKYVSLASEGQWDADNIGALHDAYRTHLINNPRYVVVKVMLLPKHKRKNAMAFLFNIFHPSADVLDEGEKKEVCAISVQFCEELSLVEKELLAEEEHH
tara:strand:- start:2090 stop:2674 length:585 start_codon:yes stop_codon:yes gene_type:complete